MSLRHVGKNAVYSLLVGVSNALFPILTFPYVARTLGPHSLGQVNFATNLSSYFILASTFGLQTYGVREIAKAKKAGNLEEIFGPLFGVSFVASILLAIIYLVLISVDNRFDECRWLFAVFAINVVGNSFLAEWFFAGMEDFRYIAFRNAAIKLCGLPFLFLFVRGPEDGFVYVIIVVASAVVPAFWNFTKIHTYVKRRFAFAGWRNHISGMTKFLVITIICSLAASMPTTYLGYMWSDNDLGLFTMAYRVIMIALMVIGSLGTVLFPYLSGVRAKDESQFDRIINRLFVGMNVIAVPASVGVWFLSERIALILGGNKFTDAGKLITYLSVVILFSVNSSFFVQQVLYPRGEESRVLKTIIGVSIAAAIVDYFLVRKWGALGASIGLICSESLILLILGYYAIKKRLVRIQTEGMWKIFVAAPLMAMVVQFMQLTLPYGHQYTVIICGAGAIVYFGVLLMLREEISIYLVDHLKKIVMERS